MYRRRKALAAAAVVIASLAFASSATAATVQVTTTTDENFVNNGVCSLREAVALTNADAATSANGCTAVGTLGADTINFSPALDGATLQLTTVADGELLITDADGLTVSGPGTGPGHLIIKAATGRRVIESTGGVPLTLNDLSVENGNVSDSTSGGAFASGGGIKAGGDLTLNRIEVSNNTVTATAAGSGNVDAMGGGIDATNGTLTITGSLITGNSATADNPLAAGNDGNATSQGGGVIGFNGSISNSTISDNQASATDEHGTTPNDSAHTFGGGVASPGVSMDHSTVSGNQASGAALEGGAGALIVGGGVFTNGTSSIQLSTIAENETTAGANAADVGGGIGSFGSLTIDSATIAANGPVSGDSAAANLWPNGGMMMKNSIVADPRGAGSENCNSSITSTGFNIDDGTSCGLNQSTDHNSTDPGLGPLVDNDGLTETMLPGSAAIDAGSATGQTDATHDQRGLARPVDSVTHTNAGDGSDIGAVEAQPPAAPTVTGTSPATPSSTNFTPKVLGGTDTGPAEGADGASNSVTVYTNASCTTAAGGTHVGTPAVFVSPGIDVTVPQNATTTFYAKAVNAYGIASPCSSTLSSNGSTSYTHDNAGPMTFFDTGPNGPTPTTDHTPAFAWHGTDLSPPISYQCSIDTGTPSFSACTSPLSSAFLADGTYTFRVKGTDMLTNTGNTVAVPFTITTPSTPPASTTMPTTPAPVTPPVKHCKKGQKLKKGKCVKTKHKK